MIRRLSTTILCIILLAGAANAAARRPTVGFLPFQGPPDSCTHVIPHLIYWQIFSIAAIAPVDVDSVVYCVEMDRLRVPADSSDRDAYSRLAVNTGVDYLVTGTIESQDASNVRFRVLLICASKPAKQQERVFSCSPGRILPAAIDVAKWIAAAIGVTVSENAPFDRQLLASRDLTKLNDSIRLSTGVDTKATDMSLASRIAEGLQSKSPANTLLAEWARSFGMDAGRNLEGYRELKRRPLGVWTARARVQPSNRRPAESNRPGIANWFTPDSGQNLVTTLPNGKTVVHLSSAWRSDVGISRRMTRDPQTYQAVLAALVQRHPNSAYLRYVAARNYARVEKWPESIAMCEQAVKINPSSFRLRVELVRAQLGGFKNQEALHTLLPMRKRWPDRTECYLLASVLYRRWKQYDKAADSMIQAREIDPEADPYHDVLAQDYIRAGMLLEAAREVAEADGNVRRSMVTFSVVLSSVFVVVALGITAIAVVALRPERPRVRS